MTQISGHRVDTTSFLRHVSTGMFLLSNVFSALEGNIVLVE